MRTIHGTLTAVALVMLGVVAGQAAAPGSLAPAGTVSTTAFVGEILCRFGLFCVTAPRPGGCDEWGCGTNSPAVDGAAIENARQSTLRSAGSFHELHVGGLPNAAGFALVGVRKGDIPYTLETAPGGIAAHPKTGAGPRLEGADLVGLVVDLRDASDRRYTLRIADTSTTPFWASPQEPTRTFALAYASADESAVQPLCRTGVNKAILFAGDRYNSEDKTVVVTGAAAAGWVNIACAGTALAKLYLTRHTGASQIVPTTRGERQAMLKMFTADGCGDGRSSTVQGQPLLWADAKGIMTLASAPASIEAIWNDTGAVCLDTARRPELAIAIAARCARPSCGGATTAAGRGHVISANPR